jgi:hypothetical protein
MPPSMSGSLGGPTLKDLSVGLIGLIGVIVGALLTWLREIWSDWRARKRHAQYLAIRVVCTLDRYVENCTDVATDDGLHYGQVNAEGCHEAQVPEPAPPAFSEDLDWQSIDPALMFEILALPSHAEAADRVISAAGEFSDAPDFTEYFEERQYQYATVGLRAFDLTQKIRKEYGIPAPALGAWEPASRLADVKREVEQERRRRGEQIAAAPPLV